MSSFINFENLRLFSEQYATCRKSHDSGINTHLKIPLTKTIESQCKLSSKKQNQNSFQTKCCLEFSIKTQKLETNYTFMSLSAKLAFWNGIVLNTSYKFLFNFLKNLYFSVKSSETIVSFIESKGQKDSEMSHSNMLCIDSLKMGCLTSKLLN